MLTNNAVLDPTGLMLGKSVVERLLVMNQRDRCVTPPHACA
jgi:hypothetical protein